MKDNFDLKKYLVENRVTSIHEEETEFNDIDKDMDQDLKNDSSNLVENIIDNMLEYGGYDPSFIKEYLKHLIDKN